MPLNGGCRVHGRSTENVAVHGGSPLVGARLFNSGQVLDTKFDKSYFKESFNKNLFPPSNTTLRLLWSLPTAASPGGRRPSSSACPGRRHQPGGTWDRSNSNSSSGGSSNSSRSSASSSSRGSNIISIQVRDRRFRLIARNIKTSLFPQQAAVTATAALTGFVPRLARPSRGSCSSRSRRRGWRRAPR